MNHFLGNAYVFSARYDEAIRQADKLLEMNPQMRAGLELKAWAIGMQGDWKKALEIFEEIHRLTNHPLKGLMGVGYASAKLGMKDRALECIQKIQQRQQEDAEAVLDGDLVGIWFALGDMNKVFYHIQQCVIKRIVPVGYFLEYPPFEGLKKDPRFLALKTNQPQ
jgi:adenylate cyclase